MTSHFSKIKPPFISVILPAYNESERIVPTLAAIEAYFAGRPYRYEVIVVSDGSLDNTEKVVEEGTRRFKNTRLVAHSPNRGKGYAVKQGMLSAHGDFLLYMDSDNAIDIGHLDVFLEEIKKGYDIVVSSVHLPGARIKLEYEWYRWILSSIGGFVMRFVAGSGLSDVLRAFKLFTRQAAKAIFPRQTIERFGFDMELMALAKRPDLPIKKTPLK